MPAPSYRLCPPHHTCTAGPRVLPQFSDPSPSSPNGTQCGWKHQSSFLFLLELVNFCFCKKKDLLALRLSFEIEIGLQPD